MDVIYLVILVTYHKQMCLSEYHVRRQMIMSRMDINTCYTLLLILFVNLKHALVCQLQTGDMFHCPTLTQTHTCTHTHTYTSVLVLSHK